MSSPQINWTEDKRKFTIYALIGVSVLCLLWVVSGGGSETQVVVIEDVADTNTTLDFVHHHGGGSRPLRVSLKSKIFEPCGRNYTDYTPCEDPIRANKFPHEHLIFHERHCPTPEEELTCLIPPPPGYKYPIPWPQSRDQAWYVNVPYKHLTVEKAVQNWIQYDEASERFIFPGGGTMFANGADSYLVDLGKLLPLDDGSIRTALDTGCGVASFGGYMLSRNVLTLSFAPRDNHEAQVQFALERGIPAMLWTLASMRLPFPARSFDLAHCSRCLIPWTDQGGLYLTEIDRVLRPGGYWVLTGPPIDWKKYHVGWNRTEADLKAEQDAIEDMAARLCWKKVVEKDIYAIFQKPLTSDCANKKTVSPPLCPEGSDADTAWYVKLEPCQTRVPVPAEDESSATGQLAKWPLRLNSVPPRITSMRSMVTPEIFAADSKLWAERVAHYKQRLLPPLGKGLYRNIMDMNAGLGGFAAALAKDPVWVMNAVPSEGAPNTLGAIFERGLIGSYQDWCEAFSTYPRTYDLIHSSDILSLVTKRCSLEKVLLEMDRILRPEGAAIIRDQVDVLMKARVLLKGMRWDARMADHEDGPKNPEKILICVKKYWST
eukprot:jgi/Mesen1/8949/ME000056S08364